MTEPTRIPPAEARQKAEAGSALLVCGYDDSEKCSKNHLEGAMFYGDFTSRLASIARDQEIIFYCA